MKTNTMGFILIIAIILVNTLFAYMGMVKGTSEMIDTFSWGFVTALVMMLGLYWMIKEEE